MVPLARYGKEKSLTMSPYKGITLAMPGRHAEDTTPKGGDFVVMVTDKTLGWKNHQFKHEDIFNDIQIKYDASPVSTALLMENYFYVIATDATPVGITAIPMVGMNTNIFLQATQCLAVAEHRRYHMHEKKYGGRFLPFRFCAGIAEGLWTAAEGGKVQKYGRPAVERLEKSNGTPVLTQKLMGTTP